MKVLYHYIFYVHMCQFLVLMRFSRDLEILMILHMDNRLHICTWSPVSSFLTFKTVTSKTSNCILASLNNILKIHQSSNEVQRCRDRPRRRAINRDLPQITANLSLNLLGCIPRYLLRRIHRYHHKLHRFW